MSPGQGFLLKKMLKKKQEICFVSKKNLFLFDFMGFVGNRIQI